MKVMYFVLKLAVSLGLFYIGIITLGHQSSSAFELGILIFVSGIFHWAFWPEIKVDESKS